MRSVIAGRRGLLIGIIAVGVLGLAGARRLSGQSPQPSRLVSFTSPDGAFHLAFPSGFVLYQGANHQDQSYIPVCRDTDIACIVYPTRKYKGTNFSAAALSIAEVNDVHTANACFSFESLQTVTKSDGSRTQDSLVSDKHPSVVINGVEFKTGTTGDAGMSHYLNTDIYRTFRGGKCYDMEINIASTSFGVYEPGTGREFTKRDAQRVHSDLMKILESIKFLK